MSALSPFARSVAVSLLGIGLIVVPASAQVAGTNPYTGFVNQPPNRPTPPAKDAYLGAGYKLSTNPYSTSVPAVVQPTGSAYQNPPLGYGSYGYGYQPPVLGGVGGRLQGYAAVTEAAGQYNVNNQQARILREQSRQASLDTQRQRINLEMEYEDLKAQRYRQSIEMSRIDALNWARTDPPNTDIWSGKPLNLLLKSILASPTPTRGPNIYLSQETLRGLNLTTGVSSGNLALGKDEGKIDWTETLGDAVFDTARNRFSENFTKAMKGAHAGEKPSRSLLMDLQADLKTLDAQLVDQVRELSPDSYIASRRILNKLKVSVVGLGDTQVVATCNDSWKKNVRTVADLVAYCQQNALEFAAAATPSDPACYQVAYLAIRSYERGVVQLASGR